MTYNFGYVGCPACGSNITRDVNDVVRKVDKARFECPKCRVDLVARVVRNVVVERDTQ